MDVARILVWRRLEQVVGGLKFCVPGSSKSDKFRVKFGLRNSSETLSGNSGALKFLALEANAD